jgi:hypothetical protein
MMNTGKAAEFTFTDLSYMQLDESKPAVNTKHKIEYHCNNMGLTISIVTYIAETNKEICCIDSDGLYLVVDKSEFIAWHPVKSELDIAKEKQVDTVSEFIFRGNYSDMDALALDLQEMGYLSEIIPPLEK